MIIKYLDRQGMVVDAHEIALRLTRLDMLVHTELETGAGLLVTLEA